MAHRTYDVAIVGGGAAGLSAALVLARARRRVVVVDAGNPGNAPAAHMPGERTSVPGVWAVGNVADVAAFVIEAAAAGARAAAALNADLAR